MFACLGSGRLRRPAGCIRRPRYLRLASGAPIYCQRNIAGPPHTSVTAATQPIQCKKKMHGINDGHNSLTVCSSVSLIRVYMHLSCMYTIRCAHPANVRIPQSYMCLCHVSCIFTIRNYVHGLGSLVYDFVGRYISNSFISICIKMLVCCVFFIVSLVALRVRLTMHIRELLNFPPDPTDFPIFNVCLIVRFHQMAFSLVRARARPALPIR